MFYNKRNPNQFLFIVDAHYYYYCNVHSKENKLIFLLGGKKARKKKVYARTQKKKINEIMKSKTLFVFVLYK